jgi:cytosine/adenosine deaminase-related metal-dependent hydrolase
VVHAAEGVDDRAHTEIAELDRLGVLRNNTFVVHAIALSDDDVRLLAERNSKVIWCPASNLRLYGKTAPVAELRRAGIDVVLGTDSTLSGADTLLDELREASRTGQVDDAELLAMATCRAADAFGLDGGHGVLAPAGRADLVVVRERGTPAASLLAARAGDLRLVLVGGRPRLAHPEIAEVLDLGAANVAIDGASLWVSEHFNELRARLNDRLGSDHPRNGLWRRVR